MKIKNFSEISLNEIRKKALSVAEAGLEAIDTQKIIAGAVSINRERLTVAETSYPLYSIERLFVIAVGKCSLDAAAELENILGEKIFSGIALDIREGNLRKIKLLRGSHPLPSSENAAATKEIISLISDLNKNDFVLFVISGGGSTLLYLPEDNGQKEETKIVKALIKTGAAIQEINTIRKHLSLARGGYLAKYAYPAKVVSLIFSDVPTNNISFIASGPTVKDETTITDAEKVITKYDILRTCEIKNCGLIETPKDDRYFENVKNILIASNATALEAMKEKAVALGFRAIVCTDCLAGEAKEAGDGIIKRLSGEPSRTVLLFGGETTVTVKGGGRGGRNQELALAALRSVKQGQLLLTVASDGSDNNTDFAGAICDILAKETADGFKLDIERYLSENNSYEFWSKIGSFIVTGITGSNVSDLIIAINE